ncbi:MAG: asparaginase [Bacteroidales bacterium]|jgi:L-asparaginase|nr:asparaginase [Bacteroidales bacterium]
MMNKPKILIIYTGGTIGMIQDPETKSLIPFNFDSIYDQIPRLSFYDIDIDTFSFENPIDSSDMNPQDWKQIAEKIYEQYHAYDGFVILHGTDTMAYTASALSFMFENLSKPIILTGAQLPLGIARTDGRNNIINSVEMASAKNADGLPMIPEVCICFESKLYRGNRTYKNNAENFDAFTSPNYPVLANVGVSIKYNKEYIVSASSEELKLHTEMDSNIAILKLFPGITASVIESILHAKGLRAVILETYGAGNAIKSDWFIRLLRDAVLRDIIIVNVTQCKGGGGVDEGKYESSYLLGKAGIVGGYDVITESAVTKIMHLLGNGNNNEKIKALFGRPLRGEMTIK